MTFSVKRFGEILILAAVLALTPGPRANGADKEVALLQTKAGELRVRQRGQERMFYLDGRPVHQTAQDTSIQRVFRLNTHDSLLLKELAGPVYCPARFRFLTLRPDGSAVTSLLFGHCHYKINAGAKGDVITVEFKPFGDLGPAVWTYDGRNLKQVQ
ncbi:MAG: hypothetical protein AB1641_17755 [Thermodesulfobacteriota bacterium]